MDRSLAMAHPLDELIFRDGFGDRLLVRDTRGRPLHETLVLRSELTGVPSFEFSLNQRLQQVDRFEHSAFLSVRQLVRLPGAVPRVSLISDHVAGGIRLSDVLSRCQTTGHPLSTGTVLFIVKEILDAISLLYRQNPDVSHGALAPERILIADGKVRICDYVLGSAIEQLRYTQERYWRELRVAVPSSAGGLRFDRRVDVAQIGMIAVALLASRPLGPAENISGLGDLVTCLTHATDHGPKPLPVPLRSWLMKALHLDLRRTYVTPSDADQALRDAMAEVGLRATPNELEMTSMRPRRASTTLTVKTITRKLSTRISSKQKSRVPPTPPVASRPPVTESALETEPDQDSPVASIANILTDRRLKNYLLYGGLAVLIAAVFAIAQLVRSPVKLFATTGTLVVESKPEGVQLFIDDQLQGVTPMTLELAPGAHKVELRQRNPRVFSVFVTKGERVSQYVEFPAVRPRRPNAP
jgi:serine/threonine protein kinase